MLFRSDSDLQGKMPDHFLGNLDGTLRKTVFQLEELQQYREPQAGYAGLVLEQLVFFRRQAPVQI